MNRDEYDILDLAPETSLDAFRCAESDLNEFLIDESKDYQTELLARTYLIVHRESGNIAAYFSLLNEVIRLV